MPRLPRILLNTFTIGSALLCLATTFLWVRSVRGGESIHWNSAMTDPPTIGREFAFYSGNSRFTLVWGRTDYPPLTAAEAEQWRSWWGLRERPVGWRRDDPRRPTPSPMAKVGVSGFGGGDLHGDYQAPWAPTKSVRVRGTFFTAPYWFPIAALAFPLILRAAARLQFLRKRETPGLCPSCGYDLRATPHRCPECGTSSATGNDERRIDAHPRRLTDPR